MRVIYGVSAAVAHRGLRVDGLAIISVLVKMQDPPKEMAFLLKTAHRAVTRVRPCVAFIEVRAADPLRSITVEAARIINAGCRIAHGVRLRRV